MDLVKAKITQKKNVYVHNDLSQSAFYFKELIENKLKDGNRSGIAYDYMACAVMIAFAFEANLNFMGYKLIKDWNEWQNWDAKVYAVLKRLEMPIVWAEGPLSSMRAMKDIRDSLAHGKPLETTEERILEVKPEDLDQANDLCAQWQKDCNHEAVFQAYKDMDDLWKEMIQKSGIPLFHAITSGEHSITVFGDKDQLPFAITQQK
jgi:hypothetical protein